MQGICRYDPKIGAGVRRRRKALALTASALARHAGIDRDTLVAVERWEVRPGQVYRRGPQPSIIAKIDAALAALEAEDARSRSAGRQAAG